jgi:hypothetical protein
MYDCNLIKSRAQKIQEYQLPNLESVLHKMQMPMIPGMPMTPPAQPESDQTHQANPLLPKVPPASTNLAVPANPLLPAELATTIDYEGLQYMNGYLRTQIGNYVEANFLVGSTNVTIVFGRLVGVGLNYILIEDVPTGDIVACDFYNLKFFRTHAHGDTQRR